MKNRNKVSARKAAALLNEAGVLARAGHVGEAIALIEGAGTLARRSRVRHRLSDLYLRAGDVERAESILVSLRGRGWNHVRVALALARTKIVRKRYDESLSFAREVAFIEPHSVPALVTIAKLLLRVGGDPDGALRVLEHARTSASGRAHAEILQLTFVAHDRRGDVTAAETALMDIVRLTPSSEPTWQALTQAAYLRHDHDAAIARGMRLLALAPGNHHVRALVANARVLKYGAGDIEPVAPDDPFPRITLFSGMAPGAPNSGGCYLQTFIDIYPKDRLSIFCVQDPVSGTRPDAAGPVCAYAPSITRRVLPANRVRWGADEGDAIEDATARHSELILRDLMLFVEHVKSTILVVIPNREVVVTVAEEIARRRAIDFTSVVLDMPSYLFRAQHIPESFIGSLLDSFAHVLRGSRGCGTVSEEMGGKFKDEYGHAPVLLNHSLPASTLVRRSRDLPGDRLRIAVVGSLYAEDAVDAFIQALDANGWKLGDRNVSLMCLTRSKVPGADPSMPIEYLGFLEQDEVVAALASAHVGYVPYWLDVQYAAATRYSFPSKLTPMAAAALPIFFHGPADSSVANFLRRNGMGIACASPEPEVILSDLRALVDDPSRYRAAVDAAETVFLTEMTYDVFRARFLQLVRAPRAAAEGASQTQSSGTVELCQMEMGTSFNQ